MPFRVSIPIFPGVRYTASTRRRRPGEPSGCAALLVIFLIAAVIGLALQYWYVTVPVLVLIMGVILIVANRDPKPAATPVWRPMSEAPKDGKVIQARHRAMGPIPIRWSSRWNAWAWVLHGNDLRPEVNPADLLEWREANASTPLWAGWRPPVNQAPKPLPASPPAPIWHPMSDAPKDGTVIVVQHRALGPLPVRWAAARNTWSWAGADGLPDYLAYDSPDELLHWREIEAKYVNPRYRKGQG